MQAGVQQLGILLLLIMCCDCFAAQKSLAELEREATDVLADPDNVSRRKRIAPLFELAARYAAAGRTNNAIASYSKGLEHHPWNLDGQIALAELLSAVGQTNSAREKAALVFERAETDTLLLRAARVLEKPFAAKLPAAEPWPENTNAVALVPVGEVEGWLVQEVRRDLQAILQIPVIIRPSPMKIPKPGRDSLHQKADDLRERLAKAKADRAFQALLRKHDLSATGLESDEEVFALTEKILTTESDKEPARRFRDEIAFLRRLGSQWDANALLDELRPAVMAVGGSQKGYLGVTSLDLYANQSRYVFGMAANGMNCGLISYWRYRSALVEDPPNRERLRERTLKQALSSVGFLFGVPRCTEPTCARAYANDLTEHDAKQPKLCTACNLAFARRFGR